MARTGRSFPSTPIILRGHVVPAPPAATRPHGVLFFGQVENQREARLRRDTLIVTSTQARIAAAPIPTNRLMQPVVVGQALFARSGRQRAKTRTVILRGSAPAGAPPPQPPVLQPIVVLADHTRLPRQPLDRVTVTRGIVAPAAPPPTPRVIQPLVQGVRTPRPSSAQTQVLRPPTITIVRPPAPLVAGFAAERRSAARYRTHVTILKGSFAPAAAPVVTKPVQIVALTRLPRQRRGRAQVTIQHGRLFAAPSGVPPPTTVRTGLAGTSGRTGAVGLSGGTGVTGLSGILGLTGNSGLTDATGSSGRTN